MHKDNGISINKVFVTLGNMKYCEHPEPKRAKIAEKSDQNSKEEFKEKSNDFEKKKHEETVDRPKNGILLLENPPGSNLCFINCIVGIFFHCQWIRESIMRTSNTFKPVAMFLRSVFMEQKKNMATLLQCLPIKYHKGQHDICEAFYLMMEKLINEDIVGISIRRKITKTCPKCGQQESGTENVGSHITIRLFDGQQFETKMQEFENKTFVNEQCDCGNYGKELCRKLEIKSEYLFIENMQSIEFDSGLNFNRNIAMLGATWQLIGFTEYFTYTQGRSGHYVLHVKDKDNRWNYVDSEDIEDVTSYVDLRKRSVNLLLFQKYDKDENHSRQSKEEAKSLIRDSDDSLYGITSIERESILKRKKMKVRTSTPIGRKSSPNQPLQFSASPIQNEQAEKVSNVKAMGKEMLKNLKNPVINANGESRSMRFRSPSPSFSLESRSDEDIEEARGSKTKEAITNLVPDKKQVAEAFERVMAINVRSSRPNNSKWICSVQKQYGFEYTESKAEIKSFPMFLKVHRLAVGFNVKVRDFKTLKSSRKHWIEKFDITKLGTSSPFIWKNELNLQQLFKVSLAATFLGSKMNTPDFKSVEIKKVDKIVQEALECKDTINLFSTMLNSRGKQLMEELRSAHMK